MAHKKEYFVRAVFTETVLTIFPLSVCHLSFCQNPLHVLRTVHHIDASYYQLPSKGLLFLCIIKKSYLVIAGNKMAETNADKPNPLSPFIRLIEYVFCFS